MSSSSLILRYLCTARILVGFYQILAQASGTLDVNLPHPIPEVVNFMKLLFGEWRAVVKLDCWDIGGLCAYSVSAIVHPLLLHTIEDLCAQMARSSRTSA